MKRLRSFLPIPLLLVLLLPLAGCGKPGTPGTPGTGGGFNAPAISSGIITSLVAVQASLQVLVNSGKTQFQSELNAITQVLDSAKLINADIQAGAFSGSTDAKIVALAGLATTLAAQFGASSNLILAINIGVGLFQSIRAAFKPPATGPVAARAPVNYKAQQDQLDATVKAYQVELSRRAH